MRNIRNHRSEIAGYPLTAQRQLLLQLIRDAGGHVDAKELYRRASSTDESISLATVYRSLRLFQELGLVEERRLGQSSLHYELRHAAEHQHFVCRDCGKIIEFRNPLIDKLVDTVQAEEGVSVARAEFYLEGYCPQCRDTAKHQGEDNAR